MAAILNPAIYILVPILNSFMIPALEKNNLFERRLQEVHFPQIFVSVSIDLNRGYYSMPWYFRKWNREAEVSLSSHKDFKVKKDFTKWS